MPIYEYQCQECGKRTEVLQKIDEAPPAACPHCNGPLKKLISSPAFHLKGSGWYATDYARKGGGESSSSGKEGSGEKGEKGKGEEGGGSKTKKSEPSESSAKLVPSSPKPSGSGSSD
jgi:putative FmdB family regulatory protein